MDYFYGNRTTFMSSGPIPWTDTTNEGAGGGGIGGQYAVDAGAGGTVTPTLTWIPAAGKTLANDPPSEPVYILEKVSAGWSTTYTPPPWTGADASDGLGDTKVATPPDFGAGETSQGMHLIQKDGSSGTIQLDPVSLEANTQTYTQSSTWGYAEAGCSLSVYVLDVFISLQGTTPDSNLADNILIGQNCTATLNVTGGPGGINFDIHEWDIQGNVFKRFDIGSNQSTGKGIPYPDPGPNGGPENNPTFYWRDAGVLSGFAPKTISVTAHLQDTSGSTVNYLGDVTATKTVNVWVPDEYDTPSTGTGTPIANPVLGTVGIDTSKNEVVSNDPSGNPLGYSLQVAVVTPDFFTSAGTAFGEWAWLQLCQINET